MLILSLHAGAHDASAALFDDYRLLAAVAEERVCRRKGAGGLPVGAVAECLAVAGRAPADIGVLALGRGDDPEACRAALGLPATVRVVQYNHHLAHALPALFHTDWDEALLYTADGGGDGEQYGARLFKDGRLETLIGAATPPTVPAIDSIGRAYGAFTEALGFSANRHEGKLTGLAAYGAPVALAAMRARFRVDAAGVVTSDFPGNDAMRAWALELCRTMSREDAAASAQKLLEEVVLEAVGNLLRRGGVRRLGLAGGVFANVRLNQRLAEELPLDEVFVYPAMGDQGLAVGGALQSLLERDGLAAWLRQRRRLDHLHLGRDWRFAEELERLPGDPVSVAADLLRQGAVVAIFTKGMEFGPRALGARSILAAPTDAAINDSLNARLDRSDFMPFAPVVREEDADAVFDLPAVSRYAARFMTVTCAVRPDWRDRIPAVVHVDGTARPQVIRRADNALYYDVLSAYAGLTGIPVLINTSFNVHEEPIIDTPAQCARALRDGRVDAVLTADGVWRA